MFKDAIELMIIVAGVFACFFWVTLFLYFIMLGITPTLGRIAISAIILTTVSVYYTKRGSSGL